MLRISTIATLLTLTAFVAHAEPKPVQVHFGDLNLSNPADVVVLDGRVHTAVTTVCASFKDERETHRFYQEWFDRCVSSMTKQANARIAAAQTKSQLIAHK